MYENERIVDVFPFHTERLRASIPKHKFSLPIFLRRPILDLGGVAAGILVFRAWLTCF